MPLFVSLVFAMDFEAAVTELSAPATWCVGAAALAPTRDPRAVAALVDAYARPTEASKLCLLDAVERLGREGAVEALLRSGDADRALAAMALVADDRWIPLLEVEIGGAELRGGRSRAPAFEALRLQRRNGVWESACVRLLGHPDPDVRVEAAALLAHRKSTRAAVEARLAIESDPRVTAALNAALAPA